MASDPNKGDLDLTAVTVAPRFNSLAVSTLVIATSLLALLGGWLLYRRKTVANAGVGLLGLRRHN